MRTLRSIAHKELRGLFQSPVALLFLAGFALSNLFLFFTGARFFTRGLADVRPLFEALPLLLIFLVSALTMRSWAEERRAGTLELLLSLPVRHVQLIGGKLLAGMVLVSLALVLTLPVPLMVSQLGPLDWGPVIGGYTAAWLLGAAYMSLGLWVSSRTDNQVVSLLVTVVLGGLLYGVGTPNFLALFNTQTAALLADLGTGSRFHSIERGVLDLPDMAYYISLSGIFLLLNGLSLALERVDTQSPSGKTRARTLRLTTALWITNLVALNVWLPKLPGARWDLTQDHEYSLSPVTLGLLERLDEPVYIRAFLTKRTHPLLAPLVYQLQDEVEEYGLAGRRIHVEVLDPNQSPILQSDLAERYGIRPSPFEVADTHSQSVVNAYFHVLVEYGGHHAVLSYTDLVDTRPSSQGGPMEVRLRNVEYDLTRTIKRAVQEYESSQLLPQRLPPGTTLTAFISPAVIPQAFQPQVSNFRQALTDLGAEAKGNLLIQEVDPTQDLDLMTELYETLGLQPLSTGGEDRFYLHLVLRNGNHAAIVQARSTLTPSELRLEVESAIRRVVPGQLLTVGLITEHTTPPDYRELEALLSERYAVERLDLMDGLIPSHVDTLLIAKAGPLAPEQQLAIDQFLLQGGSIIALAGRYQLNPKEGFAARLSEPSMQHLLQGWGVQVGSSMVLDPPGAMMPMPEPAPGGGMRARMVPYPLFPIVQGERLNLDHPAGAGITTLTFPWSSPVEASQRPEVDVSWVARSSPAAWTDTSGRIVPDFQAHPSGFPPGPHHRQETLALTLTGTFPTAMPGEDEGSLERSASPGRLAVIGSSEIASDAMMQIAAQPGAEIHRGNLQLVENLVDWAVADTQLLSIRTGGAFARVLRPLTADTARQIERTTYLATLLLMGIMVLLPWAYRRAQPPLLDEEAP